VTQGPFGGVVRWFDAPHLEEGPEVLLALQQVPAGRRRLLAGARCSP
jgi:hypothetical protein